MSETIQNFSHPDQPIRHSYPLVENEEGFAAATRICLKTMPFILIRLGALLGFTLAAIVWFALLGGIAYLFGSRGSGTGGLLLFLIGFGIPAGVYWFLREYVLYLLKLGHVAVLTKLITEGKLPDGVGQVAYGKKLITERFTQVNVLFGVDALVRGAVRAFNGTLDWVAELIPIPGMDGLMKAMHAVIYYATTFIDETIFSYNLARGDDNIWRSSADGLVYYAQNAKPVLKTGAFAAAAEIAALFASFIIGLIPAWIISHILPVSVADFSWAIAVMLAWTVREAFLQPLFLTMVALTFHKHVHDQPIEPHYADTLAAASSQFKELVEKGSSFVKQAA